MMITITLTIALITTIVQGCHNDGSLKNVGEKCKADSDCYNGENPGSVSCKSGLCACNDGYEARMQWFTPSDQHLVCVSAPYQDQPCIKICQRPFTCAETPAPAGTKTCQCLPPAKVINGTCLLECKADEIYENGQCNRKCAADENKINFNCKKIAKIGDKCDSRDQCLAPYSQCAHGVCSCLNGFTPNSKKDVCESTIRTCPVGNPIRGRDNKIVECKVKRSQMNAGHSGDRPRAFPRFDLLEDNCASGQFCALTSGESFYSDGATGHCCPFPDPHCPYGLAHPNATCGLIGVPVPDRSAKPKVTQYCPFETHSCIRFGAAGGFDTTLCCPKACGVNQVFVNGYCYPRRNWGDVCQVDEQCKGHNGACQNGKCGCDKDHAEEGGIGYRSCRRICKDNEVMTDMDHCVPRLKLGDKCDPQVFSQCPNNAYCAADTGVCDCICGYVKLDGNSCGPQPVCPNIKASADPNILDSLVNMTLCRVPGRPQSYSTSVVETCPSGQYCSSYVNDYGLCCPKPEKPFCPSGGDPGKPCDPRKPDACGIMGFCNRYLNPAGGEDSNEGYVCCSLLGIKIDRK